MASLLTKPGNTAWHKPQPKPNLVAHQGRLVRRKFTRAAVLPSAADGNLVAVYGGLGLAGKCTHPLPDPLCK